MTNIKLIIKHKMVSIKVQHCGHYGYHNPDEFLARVHCLFLLCILCASKEHVASFSAVEDLT
jgi:hypothetical protein